MFGIEGKPKTKQNKYNICLQKAAYLEKQSK